MNNIMRLFLKLNIDSWHNYIFSRVISVKEIGFFFKLNTF